MKEIHGTAISGLDFKATVKVMTDAFNERIQKYFEYAHHVAEAESIASYWCKPKKHIEQKFRKWRRWTDISFCEWTGQFTITLHMAQSDSIKTTIAQFLECFMKYHTHANVYDSSETIEYNHVLPSGLKLCIKANAKHSSSCRQVPTGKMIPEMKLECK